MTDQTPSSQPSPKDYDTKIGIVLSGGGMLGAYQAGVVRALAEQEVPVKGVAGTSIGALNGALVATASNMRTAADHLEEVWTTLAKESVLHPNIPGWVQLFLGAGLRPPLLNVLKKLESNNPLISELESFMPSSEGAMSESPSFFKTSRIHDILVQNISPEALAEGNPLYVAVFPESDAQSGLVEGIKKCLGLDTPPSEFIHIQNLPDDQRYEAILASAALPLIFGHQKVGDNNYVDGGIGGGRKAFGNTPATPLVEAGYSHLIVSHLSQGTLWNRYDFPDTTILEVPIQEPIEREGSINNALKLNEDKGQFLMHRGYEDTLASMGRIQEVLEANYRKKRAELTREQKVSDAISQVDNLNNDRFSNYFGNRSE